MMMKSMTVISSKIFAVGDIHGCFDKLSGLLRRLPFNRDVDALIFLGDYINRGPDTSKVLDFLIDLKATCANVTFLKGNHEQLLLEYAESGDPESLQFLRMMGISNTVKSYGSSIAHLRELSCFPAKHRDFLWSLEFGKILGKTIFVHADINEKIIEALRRSATPPIIDSVDETTLLSSRQLAQENRGIPDYTVVFGHVPLASPLVLEDRIGIDTGAVYGNMLTALELPAGRFHHA